MQLGMPTRQHHNPAFPAPRSPARAAFTIIEVLVAVLVIGIILSLLIVAARNVRQGAASTAAAAAARSVKAGVAQFQTEFGFLPPLVREQPEPLAPAPLPAPTETVPGSAPAQLRLRVYSPVADGVVSADYQRDLRRPAASVPADNPLLDNRFSKLSLAYYLVGAGDAPFFQSNNPPIPIDGAPGNGFFKPNQDGTWQVPADVRTGAAASSSRTSGRFDPLVEIGGAIKLDSNARGPNWPELRDVNNAAIRYYRWLNGRESPANSGRYVIETSADLRIPLMVGIDSQAPGFNAAFSPLRADRDVSANPALRQATYAIVAAGPNGVFGDEPVADLIKALNKPTDAGNATEVIKLRKLAWEDNIVEVGQ